MRVNSSSPIPASVRILAFSAASALILLMAVIVTADRAAADPPCFEDTGNGEMGYCNDRPGDEESGDDGGSEGTSGGGSGEPSCSHLESFKQDWPGATRWYCEGQNACWELDPPPAPPREEWPEPPSPDAGQYIYKLCEDPQGNETYADFTWSGIEEEPPLEEQAETAFGQLDAPPFELAFSPPGESVIYIDTWWWAEGAPSGNREGSSAFGLVAIAQPDHLEVDPGNGGDTITCDFVTTESDACTYTYERASGDGGYPARARLVYDVTFEENGEPIDIPGAPDTFQSAWEETAVPVVEVQSNVVR
jgi:hypothetical protein